MITAEDAAKNIQSKADTYADTEGDSASSLLSTVIIAEQYDLAETLLESGADALIRDDEGNNTLHLLADYYMVPTEEDVFSAAFSSEFSDLSGLSDLSETEEKPYIRLIKKLIARGVDINARNNEGQTPLFKAIATERATSHNSPPIELIKTLLEFKADPSIASLASTPLHHAVCWNALELAKILVAKGAKVNAKDQEDATPLFKVQSIEMLQLLLELQADLSITRKDGQTLLHCCSNDLIPAFVRLKVPIEAVDNNGFTPLAAAIHTENTDRCKILLENKANANGSFGNGDSYLNRAITRNYIPVTELLLQHRAHANVKDKLGHLPVDIAIYYSSKQLRLARTILKYGINVNDVLEKGETVLDRALQCHSSSFLCEVMEASIEMPRHLIRYLPKVLVSDNVPMVASFLCTCQADSIDIRTFAKNILTIILRNASNIWGSRDFHYKIIPSLMQYRANCLDSIEQTHQVKTDLSIDVHEVTMHLIDTHKHNDSIFRLFIEILKIESVRILSQSHIQYWANIIENLYLKTNKVKGGLEGKDGLEKALDTDTTYFLYDYDDLEKFIENKLDIFAPIIFKQHGKEIQEIFTKLSSDKASKPIKIPKIPKKPKKPKKPSKEKEMTQVAVVSVDRDPILNLQYWLLYYIKICIKTSLSPRVSYCFLKPYIEIALFEDHARKDIQGNPVPVLPSIVPATAAEIIVSYLSGICTGSEFESVYGSPHHKNIKSQKSTSSFYKMANVLTERLNFLKKGQEKCKVTDDTFKAILYDRKSPLLPLYEELVKKPKPKTSSAVPQDKGDSKRLKRSRSDMKTRKFKKFS